MNLMKKVVANVVVVFLATAWLIMLSVKGLIVAVTVGMRTMLGENGEIFMFFLLMMASVFLTGLTGTLIALLKNY